jgi:putative transposase
VRAAVEATPALGLRETCEALGVSRSTLYRTRVQVPDVEPSAAEAPSAPKPSSQPRALSLTERAEILEVLTSERFADQAPHQVYAQLLDEGVYLCSIRTMYRILAEHGAVKERRDQLRHPAYRKPELLAVRPNQVWSWDITKLLGPQKWTYYYLYVIMDVFSRHVVGWTVQLRESAEIAEQLIAQAIAQQQITRGQLTLHADRGSSMRSKPVAFLLADLGVTKTHSRPYTSTDNPYSEAQFKTMKYRPGFPERFGSIEVARDFCRPFFDWYSHTHRHSGIGLMTPAAVHYGRAGALHAERAHVLASAYAANPERFVRGIPSPPALPTAAWINRPSTQEAAR